MSKRYRRRESKKRVAKARHDLTFVLLIVLAAVAVAAIFYLTLPPASTSRSGGEPGPQGDVFTGKITNTYFVGSIGGTVQADTNCRTTGMYTNCTAIITADDGRELHFNYVHNMMEEPCLTQGDRIVIEASPDSVKVVR